MFQDVDPDDVVRVIQIKNDLIEDLETQVKSLTDQLESNGRNGSRVRRRTKRMETFKTKDDPNWNYIWRASVN